MWIGDCAIFKWTGNFLRIVYSAKIIFLSLWKRFLVIFYIFYSFIFISAWITVSTTHYTHPLITVYFIVLDRLYHFHKKTRVCSYQDTGFFNYFTIFPHRENVNKALPDWDPLYSRWYFYYYFSLICNNNFFVNTSTSLLPHDIISIYKYSPT